MSKEDEPRITRTGEGIPVGTSPEEEKLEELGLIDDAHARHPKAKQPDEREER